MTIAATNLDAEAFPGGGPWTTASYTPAPNALLLATVFQFGGTGPPSLSGNGLTWVQVDAIAYNLIQFQLWVFRALGPAPSAGGLTVTFPNQPVYGSVHVDQFTGVDTTGTNGSGAIIQSTHDRADESTGVKPKASSFTIDNYTQTAADATFGAFYDDQDPTAAITAGTTSLGSTTHSHPSLDAAVLTEWSSGAVYQSASDSAVVRWGGVGIEIKAGAVLTGWNAGLGVQPRAPGWTVTA